MNIGFTYNVRHVKPDMDDPQYIMEAEFDEPATIAGIYDALQGLGHTVFCIEADHSAYKKLHDLRQQLDLVFNIAEGMHGLDREAQIPAMLEMLEIPYTGPSPLGYALGLHKAKAKEVLLAHKIPTPRWFTARAAAEIRPDNVDFFPAIVKPLGEGSSKGIGSANLVGNHADLVRVADDIIRQHGQSVIIEEYIEGREFTVALLGTPPRVLPIIEVTFDALPAHMPKFDHYEAKWVYDDPQHEADPLVCPAKISPALAKKISQVCRHTFQALEMADWARIDLRLKKSTPYVIEINCPPGIIPDPRENSRFPRAARAAGLAYDGMIAAILKSACHRYGIKYNCIKK
ncbi:D-alanine--D-alanine ligase [Patescibacteria group bacterium]|nr:D-alanine--D-alanine ligase [Patescibacteria group bacterium]MBU1673913.1 D-alanine--D-alanine ligase [Patescibacteria group bacterium]MBU1963907.1 D-alanine--D-alanine ligase [Patescibacteria group bacterium]